MKTYVFTTCDMTTTKYRKVLGAVKAESIKDAKKKINNIDFVRENCDGTEIYEIPDKEIFFCYTP